MKFNIKNRRAKVHGEAEIQQGRWQDWARGVCSGSETAQLTSPLAFTWQDQIHSHRYYKETPRQGPLYLGWLDFELHRQVTGTVVPVSQAMFRWSGIWEAFPLGTGRRLWEGKSWTAYGSASTPKPLNSCLLERILYILCGLGGQTKTSRWEIERPWLSTAEQWGGVFLSGLSISQPARLRESQPLAEEPFIAATLRHHTQEVSRWFWTCPLPRPWPRKAHLSEHNINSINWCYGLSRVTPTSPPSHTHTHMQGPYEHTVKWQPSASQREGSPQNSIMPAPWSQTCRLQNCEKINFCFELPSLWCFVMEAQAD